jgi:transposase
MAKNIFTPQERQALQLQLKGLNNSEIAKILGISRPRVFKLLKHAAERWTRFQAGGTNAWVDPEVESSSPISFRILHDYVSRVDFWKDSTHVKQSRQLDKQATEILKRDQRDQQKKGESHESTKETNKDTSVV